eukprot:s2423_g20.t3
MLSRTVFSEVQAAESFLSQVQPAESGQAFGYAAKSLYRPLTDRQSQAWDSAVSVGDRIFNTRRQEVAEVIGFDHVDDPVVVKPNQLRSAWPRCVIERLTSVGDRDFKVKMSNGKPAVWYAHKCIGSLPKKVLLLLDARLRFLPGSPIPSAVAGPAKQDGPENQDLESQNPTGAAGSTTNANLPTLFRREFRHPHQAIGCPGSFRAYTDIHKVQQT